MGKVKAVEEEDVVMAEAPEKKTKKSKKDKEDAEAAPEKESKSKRKDKADGDDKPAKKAKKAADAEAEEPAPKKKSAKAAKEAPAEEAAPEPPAADPNSLDNFALSPAVRAKLREGGIAALFPIQAATFKVVMDGNDLVGRARTGQARQAACFLASTARR